MKSMRRMLAAGLVIGAFALVASPTMAVSFKMKNDTRSKTFRARVHDRGEWRPWVIFGPGGWGKFAASVKRAEHKVQIDVRTKNGWQSIYRYHHGSRLWTRVVQVVERPGGQIVFGWWDEPGFGCRDQPPHPKRGGKSCLKSSGWMWGAGFEVANKIGEAYVAGQ